MSDSVDTVVGSVAEAEVVATPQSQIVVDPEVSDSQGVGDPDVEDTDQAEEGSSDSSSEDSDSDSSTDCEAEDDDGTDAGIVVDETDGSTEEFPIVGLLLRSFKRGPPDPEPMVQEVRKKLRESGPPEQLGAVDDGLNQLSNAIGGMKSYCSSLSQRDHLLRVQLRCLQDVTRRFTQASVESIRNL